MLDQSFSAHNFEVIFTMENRKGHIDITMMSQAYQDVLTEIKNVKMQVQNIRKRKKSDRTPEEMLALEKLDSRIKDLQKEKIEVLVDDMSSIADDVNSKSFKFEIDKRICMRTRKSSPYGIQKLLILQ